MISIRLVNMCEIVGRGFEKEIIFFDGCLEADETHRCAHGCYLQLIENLSIDVGCYLEPCIGFLEVLGGDSEGRRDVGSCIGNYVHSHKRVGQRVRLVIGATQEYSNGHIADADSRICTKGKPPAGYCAIEFELIIRCLLIHPEKV